MVHLTPIFSIFNRKAMSNMFFSFLLIFGVFLPFSITPVYASFPSSLQAILPVYTTPLIPSLSVEMTHSMLQYIHNFQYPCFSNTEYYGVYPWGSGFNFEYRVILYPKSKSYFMRGNGYTTAQINSFTYRLKEYTQTITYRFNSSGSYLGMSTSTSSVGLTVPMSSFYYMDLPQVLITNYDFNAIPPDTYYNPYTTGAKVTLDASRYTSSTTVLGQGLAVSDANLKKMLDVVQAADPYWTTGSYYLLRPIMASTLITHWQLLLIPNRTESDYLFNRFLAYDYETTEWIDAISLQTKGDVFPVSSYLFDTAFNFLISSEFTDVTNVDYTHTMVSYSDVPTEMRIVSAQSPDPSIYVTVEDSPELRLSVGQRPLPQSVLDLYAVPPDARLSNDVDIPDDTLIKMFNYVGSLNKDWYMNQGVYAIYGSEGNYVLVLSRKDRGKFLFQVKDGSDKSPISKWYYWSPSAWSADDAVLFYTFSPSGDFIRRDTTKDNFSKVVTASIYYGNAECLTYTIRGETIAGKEPSRDCANYGLRAVPVSVYNAAFTQWNEGLEFIDGSYDQVTELDVALPDLLSILHKFFTTSDTLTPLIGFMPQSFIKLSDISLKIFIFMLVYKVIRVIRGLTV